MDNFINQELLKNLNLTEFELVSEGEKINFLPLTETGIKANINATISLKKNFLQDKKYFVLFFTISGINNISQEDLYLSRKYIVIGTDVSTYITTSSINLPLNYLIDDSNKLLFSSLTISLSLADKKPGESGVNKSIKYNTFYTVNIPIVDERSN
ncbi:hypothetical protein [Ligilactobacillus salivarius]|uniref:hypothetical protein n=1 Tax=Ligilactobacillus salivarius TaxID=1624 RepID=UPI0020238791|nr:hypothetical protein [Ligilactobacillus salivarius]URI13432.1 hypothetical protein M9Y03_03325 [Ligilactobacillus salivarius]UUB35269.1 hypothetical protein NO469_03325 [Ligilactobacillus salivarius]